ncbi:MAG: hypothetical protein IKX70_06760 [Treponema sp.]|nr:hypothetical protein [Treponema sp.]
MVFYGDPKDRDAYLKGDVVFYLDHDIPIKNSKQFMKELEKRVKPYELTITQQIKDGHIKHADKWIHNGWRIFCYDDFETSFKYGLDFRFDRLVNGHFRGWSVFMHEKSIELSLVRSFELQLDCTWGEFIAKESNNDDELLKQLAMLLTEVFAYIIPFFHSTKIIAASDKAEYQFIQDYLRGGVSLDYTVDAFSKYFRLPLWITDFDSEENIKGGIK